jgi:hypothetical protein
MLITRRSPFTGKLNTLDLPVTVMQMREFDSPSRRKIQDIFPDLTAGQREFIFTGYTEEDWATLFPPEEE